MKMYFLKGLHREKYNKMDNRMNINSNYVARIIHENLEKMIRN